MKRIVILVVAGFVTGCGVTPPRTAEELREGVRRGAAFTKMEQEEVNRPFAETFEAIKKNADKCMNVTVIGSTWGKYGPVMESVRYRSYSKMTSEQTAETVLQQSGSFVMLTDIEPTSSLNKTRVSMYGASVGYDNVFKSIFAWARGEKQKCPKFPMGGLGRSFKYDGE